MKTKVVFRKFMDGEIVAVFPDISYNYILLMSYTHIGQHGGCAPRIASFTRPATPEEYAPLLQELREIGYGDLHVIQKITGGEKRSFCQYGNKDLPKAITAA